MYIFLKLDDLNTALYATSGRQKRKKRAVKTIEKKAQTSTHCIVKYIIQQLFKF